MNQPITRSQKRKEKARRQRIKLRELERNASAIHALSQSTIEMIENAKRGCEETDVADLTRTEDAEWELVCRDEVQGNDAMSNGGNNGEPKRGWKLWRR